MCASRGLSALRDVTRQCAALRRRPGRDSHDAIVLQPTGHSLRSPIERIKIIPGKLIKKAGWQKPAAHEMKERALVECFYALL